MNLHLPVVREKSASEYRSSPLVIPLAAVWPQVLSFGARIQQLIFQGTTNTYARGVLKIQLKLKTPLEQFF
jgi:hypothetical protein